MMFKQPSNGCNKIGRKVEFSNPLRYSNKKHFWAGGVGNYGLLTTEQIQILNQMKQRQRKAHLYDRKCIEQSLNHSIKDIKYPGSQRLKTQNKYCLNPFQLNNGHQNKEGLRNQLFDPRQGLKRRSVSEFRSYDEVQPEGDKFYTIAHLEDYSGLTDFKKAQSLKRLESDRRAKTMGVEQISAIQNPQEVNKIDQMFSGLVSRQKKLRIDSGNIRFDHSPESIKEISKSIQKQKSFLQPNIYSERSKQESELNPHTQGRNIKDLKQQILDEPQKIYKKMKRLDQKMLTRHKFRRDYSPTYCNSIEYPLKYFRHI